MLESARSAGNRFRYLQDTFDKSLGHGAQGLTAESAVGPKRRKAMSASMSKLGELSGLVVPTLSSSHFDPHQTGDPAASSALKSVNAHPGLTTAAAVTQTFNGWIRPAACAPIGVR